MNENDINMDKIIDNQCSIVMEFANYILLYKDMLKDKNLDKEVSQVLPTYISEYTSVINEFTNNSADFILIWAHQINDAQMKLETEENSNRKEMLEHSINILKDSIRKKVSKSVKGLPESTDPEVTKGTSPEMSKLDAFRESKKVNIDPVTQANELSKMCEEHQKELENDR